MTFMHLLPSTPAKPILCFIPGFRSQCLNSKKCDHLFQLAHDHGYGFVAWDHLEDDNEASVLRWFEDSRDLLNTLYPCGRLVVAGASMGAWVALLLARTPLCIEAIVGIGASVDSTERLLSESPVKDPWHVWNRPSSYSPEGYYPIHISFLKKSRPALLLDRPVLDIPCPVHLIHGARDHDSPLSHAHRLQKHLHALLDIVPDGDHRLSRECDLEQTSRTLLHYLRQSSNPKACRKTAL